MNDLYRGKEDKLPSQASLTTSTPWEKTFKLNKAFYYYGKITILVLLQVKDQSNNTWKS